MARLSAKKVQWFEIPGDEDGAKLKIQYLTPGELQKISGDTSRWVGKKKEEDFESELEYAPLEQIRKTRLAAIVDWEGFIDEEGNVMKFSEANKARFLDFDPILGTDKKNFSEWIDEFRKEIDKQVAPEEELEKN